MVPVTEVRLTQAAPLERIMVEAFCSPGRAQELARQVLASPSVADSISKNEKVFRLGAEMQGVTSHELQPFMAEFETLRSWLAKRFSAEVSWHPQMPVPGFHIFYATAPNGGKAHADGQAFSAANYLDARFLSAWSIVVALNLPKEGGGIHFWTKPLSQLARDWGKLSNPMPAPDFTQKLVPGQVLIFDSRLVHQIEGFQIEDPRDARVTLVAHLGEIEPGRYIYFWDRLKNVRNYFGIMPEFERLYPTDPLIGE